MKNRWTWVALVAIMFGFATPLAYADDDDDDGGGGGGAIASLNGESFISQEVGQGSEVSESMVTGECNPNLLGTSTFEFDVAGLSAGLNYPGTFTESGTLVVDPLGMNTSFESTFTITSGATMIIGSKSLITSILAICGNVAIGSGGPDAIWFEGNVSYTAMITTPNGTRNDSGTAFVSYQDFDDPNLTNSHSFTENFTSNDPGGGGGGDDDDDDDDGDDD
jgi:hypothetical protein